MTAMCVVAGCGGSGGGVMRATLTDEGCTYEGDTTPPAGMFSIEVRNETTRFTHFTLVELADDATIEEIAPSFKKAEQNYMQTGVTPKESEVFKRGIAFASVEPEATSELPANESPGRYAVICTVGSVSDTRETSNAPDFPSRVYAPVELDVVPRS
jgi:hypothetical protein